MDFLPQFFFTLDTVRCQIALGKIGLILFEIFRLKKPLEGALWQFTKKKNGKNDEPVVLRHSAAESRMCATGKAGYGQGMLGEGGNELDTLKTVLREQEINNFTPGPAIKLKGI